MDTSSVPTRTRSVTTSKLYRSAAERRPTPLRDPIHKMQRCLIDEGILDESGDGDSSAKVDAKVRAAERALEAALPEIESNARHVYSEDLRAQRSDCAAAAQRPRPRDTDETHMADLINRCLHDEMRRDPRIVVFGEDVADASQRGESAGQKVKGKGGVFKLTAGLQPSSARIGSSTRRWRRRISSAAPSAWPSAD